VQNWAVIWLSLRRSRRRIAEELDTARGEEEMGRMEEIQKEELS
jgi:hypothetical protein